MWKKSFVQTVKTKQKNSRDNRIISINRPDAAVDAAAAAVAVVVVLDETVVEFEPVCAGNNKQPQSLTVYIGQQYNGIRSSPVNLFQMQKTLVRPHEKHLLHDSFAKT